MVPRYDLLLKFSPAMAEVCEASRKLTSVKGRVVLQWITPRSICKSLMFITGDSCVKFYGLSRPWHLEMVASGTDLRAGSVQM